MAKGKLSPLDKNQEGFTRLDRKVSKGVDSGPESCALVNCGIPPDGGWGWLVVLSSFIIHVIADGIVYSFGIFMMEFVVYFKAGRGAISWIGALQPAVTFAVGPLVSVLTKRYGCRKVTIAGAIIAAAGFVGSAFAPGLYYLYFTSGVMAGVGFGFIYLPAIVCVAQYFEKKRSLATGLAVCGSGFGTFILAPLTVLLVQEFSWQGAMLILGCIILNVIICGILFRPLKTDIAWPRKSSHEFENGVLLNDAGFDESFSHRCIATSSLKSGVDSTEVKSLNLDEWVEDMEIGQEELMRTATHNNLIIIYNPHAIDSRKREMVVMGDGNDSRNSNNQQASTNNNMDAVEGQSSEQAVAENNRNIHWNKVLEIATDDVQLQSAGSQLPTSELSNAEITTNEPQNSNLPIYEPQSRHLSTSGEYQNRNLPIFKRQIVPFSSTQTQSSDILIYEPQKSGFPTSQSQNGDSPLVEPRYNDFYISERQNSHPTLCELQNRKQSLSEGQSNYISMSESQNCDRLIFEPHSNYPSVSESENIDPSVLDPNKNDLPISERRNSANSASEPQNSDSHTSEPQKSDSHTSEPQKSDNYIYELQNSESSATETKKSEHHISETQHREDRISEPQNSDSSILEPQNSETQTSQPENTNSRISEPQISDSSAPELQKCEHHISESQNSDSRISKLQNSDTHTSEPQNSGSHTSEPQNSGSHTSEPQNSETHTTEPQNSRSPTSEPQNLESSAPESQNYEHHISESQNSDSRISKLQNSDTHTSEPQNSGSHTSEPQNSGSHTSEPQNSSSHTSEPKHIDPTLSKHNGSDNSTIEYQNRDLPSTEPQNNDIAISETQDSNHSLSQHQNSYLLIYEPQSNNFFLSEPQNNDHSLSESQDSDLSISDSQSNDHIPRSQNSNLTRSEPENNEITISENENSFPHKSESQRIDFPNLLSQGGDFSSYESQKTHFSLTQPQNSDVVFKPQKHDLFTYDPESCNLSLREPQSSDIHKCDIVNSDLCTSPSSTNEHQTIDLTLKSQNISFSVPQNRSIPMFESQSTFHATPQDSDLPVSGKLPVFKLQNKHLNSICHLQSMQFLKFEPQNIESESRESSLSFSKPASSAHSVSIRNKTPCLQVQSDSALISPLAGKPLLQSARISKYKTYRSSEPPSYSLSCPITTPISRKDIFYTGSLNNIPMYRSHPEIYKAIMRAGPDQDAKSLAEMDTQHSQRCLIFWRECRATMKDMLSLSLLKNPVFLMFAVSNFFTSLGFNMPFIFLPDRAKQAGIDEDSASLLLSVIGIANTAGRIFFGFLSDRPWINRLILYNSALTICGVGTALSPLVGGDYLLLMTYAAVFGIFIGVYVSLTSVVLVDLLGLDHLTNSFGLLLLFQGAATFVGPPIAGLLFDRTGNYDISFLVMGSLVAFSGVMLFFLPFVQRCTARGLSSEQTVRDLELGKKPVTDEDVEIMKAKTVNMDR